MIRTYINEVTDMYNNDYDFGDHPDRDLGNNPFDIDFSDDAYYGKTPTIPGMTVLMDADKWDKEHGWN